MVDPFNVFDILKTIVDLVKKFTDRLRLIKDNQKDRDRLLKHIENVSGIVDFLQQKLKDKTNIMKSAGHQMMRNVLKGLEKTLELGLKDIEEDCVQRKDVEGFYKTGHIARKLRQIGDDIKTDMMLVMFATIACTFSMTDEMHADLKKLVKAVDDKDAASIRSMLAGLSKQILVEGLPDLPPQVKESVQNYSTSITNQNNDKKEAIKKKVHSPGKGSPKKKNVDVDRRASRATLSDASNRQRAMEHGETSGSKKIPSTCRSFTSKTSSKPVEVIRPLEIGCTWQSLEESVQCAVMTLTNTTDSYVAVCIDPPRNGQFTCPRSTIVEPKSTLALAAKIKMQELRLPRDNPQFVVRMMAVETKEVDKLRSASVGGKVTMDSGKFEELVNKLHGKVFTETVTAISSEPTSSQYQIIPTIIVDTEIPMRSTDVHPTEPWVVLVSTERGRVHIWDYQKKKKLIEVQSENKACSAKFIVHKEWLAVGTADGFIYIYSYNYKCTKLGEVHKFKADEDGKAINSLAVHPSDPPCLLLSTKARIMQWSSLKDDEWKRIRTVQPSTVGIQGLKYNPSDGDTFVAVTQENTARIYTTQPSRHPVTILEGSSSADYFPTDSSKLLVVTCQNASSNCKVRNLDGKFERTLEVSGRKIEQVACHTKQKILATSTFIEKKDKGSTTLEDGTICLWDAGTNRLEKMVRIPGMGRSHFMQFATDTNGLTRLFVMFGTKIAILEVNSAVTNTRRRNGGNG